MLSQRTLRTVPADCVNYENESSMRKTDRSSYYVGFKNFFIGITMPLSIGIRSKVQRDGAALLFYQSSTSVASTGLEDKVRQHIISCRSMSTICQRDRVNSTLSWLPVSHKALSQICVQPCHELNEHEQCT